jgi:hypothetical protein
MRSSRIIEGCEIAVATLLARLSDEQD